MSLGEWAYLILFLIGLFILGIACWKSKSFEIIILYFTVAGVTLLFDYFIYLWGNAYVYQLNVLHHEADSHLGAMVNGLLLPAFAALFVVMRRKWYWSIPLALFFTLIEHFYKMGNFYNQLVESLVHGCWSIHLFSCCKIMVESSRKEIDSLWYVTFIILWNIYSTTFSFTRRFKNANLSC